MAQPYGITVSMHFRVTILMRVEDLSCLAQAHWLTSIDAPAPVPTDRQENIDESLGMCTEDLFIDMCERQIDYVSPASYAPNASYIPYRRYLVDWMSDVGEQCNLHTTTVHCSILFLDKIFRSR